MASPSDRETAVYMAKLAEEAERFDDMLEHIKKVARMHMDLTADEKVLLSVAYKNVIGFRRASWRVLTSIEIKEESRGNEVDTKRIKEYRGKLETEINDICNDAISVVNELISDATIDPESSVFYKKMIGDYYRYLAEIKSGPPRQAASSEAFTAYEAAIHTAELELPRAHPIRLGVALNYAVYFYEIMNVPQRAKQIAVKAFDEAVTELDTLNEESYKDSKQILHLLRDNLVQWGYGEDEKAPSKDGGDGAPSKDGGDGANQVGHSDVLATGDDK